MSVYNDPTVCHPGECGTCGRHVHDRDNLDDDGDCTWCVDEKIEALAEERRQEMEDA